MEGMPMSRWHALGKVALVAALWFLASGTADAAWIRFHFVPVEGCKTLKPVEPSSDGTRQPKCFHQPGPLVMVNLCHLYTGQQITVPLYLPEGTPTIQHVWSKIVYNYGSYTVAVRFLPDGSVDVIYSSGLLRGL